MNYKKLGNSDMEISRIGIGAWAIGGKWEWGWGAQDDRDSINTIQHALTKGINWIDTAPVYGLGHSEEVVGKAIKGLSEKPLIFTKCSFTWNDHGEITPSLKAENIRREVEDSLRRMDIECIDLYQIHWPNPEEEIEEGWQTMVDLKKEGKIRYLGVSNHSIDQMKRLQAIAPITSQQPPYSLVNRSYEDELLPFCQENNTGVICYSPMGSGILTGKMTRERIDALEEGDWRKNAEDFKEPKLNRNLQIVEKLIEVGNQYGCSAAEVAIAWVLKNPSVTAAIVGMRSPEQADGVIGGATLELTPQDIDLIESV